MHDIVNERLVLSLKHAKVIHSRMTTIIHEDDFIKTENGEILLDAIITRLQALSENFKQIEKITPGFIVNNLELDVLPVIRFRDLASHHYETLNHKIIFHICREEIPFIITSIGDFLEKGLSAI
jgi:uncharacterized protein with HEPN domain